MTEFSPKNFSPSQRSSTSTTTTTSVDHRCAHASNDGSPSPRAACTRTAGSSDSIDSGSSPMNSSNCMIEKSVGTCTRAESAAPAFMSKYEMLAASWPGPVIVFDRVARSVPTATSSATVSANPSFSGSRPPACAFNAASCSGVNSLPSFRRKSARISRPRPGSPRCSWIQSAVSLNHCLIRPKIPFFFFGSSDIACLDRWRRLGRRRQ